MHALKDDDIIIGKDVLELLSGAMYAEPLNIFREYVQNAVDSIDEAEAASLYSEDDTPKIEIYQDILARSVTIRDNGAAINKKLFKRRLTSFGASKKRGTEARGFRGVGRLAGLGYCRELVFRSRTQGAAKVSELRWDCVSLKRLLRDHECQDDLREVVRKIISVSHDVEPKEDDPPRFFEVEMVKVIRLGNDLLLNENILENYLSQVAPVPFHPDFRFGQEIKEKLAERRLGKTYEIFLQGRTSAPVYRPERNDYSLSESITTRFHDVWWIDLPGIEEKVMAFGWVLHSEYLGAFPKSSGLGGIRLRAGNVQVGDNRILDEAFPEARFNPWTVGEFHVMSDKLLPNGRRDDFEHNAHYDHLKSGIKTYASGLAKVLRNSSSQRNLLKESALTRTKAAERWEQAVQFGISGELRTELLEKLEYQISKIENSVSEGEKDGKDLYVNKLTEEKQKLNQLLKNIGKSLKNETPIDFSSMKFSTEDLLRVVLENCEPEVSRKILDLLKNKNTHPIQ